MLNLQKLPPPEDLLPLPPLQTAQCCDTDTERDRTPVVETCLSRCNKWLEARWCKYKDKQFLVLKWSIVQVSTCYLHAITTLSSCFLSKRKCCIVNYFFLLYTTVVFLAIIPSLYALTDDNSIHIFTEITFSNLLTVSEYFFLFPLRFSSRLIVISSGQVVMSTTAGLTGLNGQQLVTQLVPSQGMQGQVVHQTATPIGVTTTLASAISQGQVEWTIFYRLYKTQNKFKK